MTFCGRVFHSQELSNSSGYRKFSVAVTSRAVFIWRPFGQFAPPTQRHTEILLLIMCFFLFTENSVSEENNAVLVNKLGKGSAVGGRQLLPMRRGKRPGPRLLSRPSSRLLPRPAPAAPAPLVKPPRLPTYFWTEWSAWSNCSRVCGGGVSVRTRRCIVRGTCGSVNVCSNFCAKFKIPCKLSGPNVTRY